MVMNENLDLRPSLPPRRAAAALLAAGCLLSILPAPARGASVGLSSVRSALFVERSQEGFSPATEDLFGFAFVAADFNGNGTDELVTGIPLDDCNALATDCGAAFLSWGNPGLGLIDQGGFLWADRPGSPVTAQAGDKYGRALAAGDFNHDGLADLVIGAPNGGLGTISGNVQIHYGLPGAIQIVPEHVLQPGVNGVPDDGMHESRRDARFGTAFAVGDFNGDGHSDLAIGAPDWAFEGGPFDAGAVVVAHGHVGGLIPFDGFLVTQDEAGIPDAAEFADDFGAALAAGDFNGDGFDDLVVGVPLEDGVGAILVLFGSPNSLIFANHYWLGEFDLGSTGAANDHFGQSLVTGDFDGDGFDDLVIGVPDQDDGDGDVDVGMVGILFGAAGSPLSEPSGGFDFASRQWWWEDLFGEGSNVSEHFGAALATGDFDGDGFRDLAVATPHDDSAKGAVTVFAGSANRLFERRDRFVPQADGLPPAPVQQDGFRFGKALVAGDFDGNGYDDLVIGAPHLNLEGAVDAGGAFVLYGSLFSDGFESEGTARWSATTP